MAARPERSSAKPKKQTRAAAPSGNGARPPKKAAQAVKKSPAKLAPPPPPPPPPPRPRTTEERMMAAEERLQKASEAFRRTYLERLDMSWIYHDSALEGVVYTSQELRDALGPTAAPVLADSSLQPVCDEIRRHRDAINYLRDLASKKRLPITVDTVKKIFLILHPEEGDLKTVKYRKEIPQHRLYFHEYAAPDKIGFKVRQVVDWVNDPETRKTRSVLRIAGRAHYDLLRAFPFAQDSGKVARLLMNLLLMRGGYPPAIIHSAERQRYYEALKGSPVAINAMVSESIENALSSVEKMLDEYETKTRSFA